MLTDDVKLGIINNIAREVGLEVAEVIIVKKVKHSLETKRTSAYIIYQTIPAEPGPFHSPRRGVTLKRYTSLAGVKIYLDKYPRHEA